MLGHVASAAGKGCTGPISAMEPCNEQCCPEEGPEDCAWGQWSDWSDCSRSCDAGLQSRSREVTTFARGGGKACEAGAMQEYQPCSTDACNPASVNGLWGPWGVWQACSATCGGGAQMRERKVVQHAKHGGIPVSGVFEEYQKCGTAPCAPPVDCLIGPWSAWSVCSSACNGVQNRTRPVDRAGANGGKPCAGELVWVTPCNLPGSAPACAPPAPPACVFQQWSDWSKCSASCLGGTRTRKRSVDKTGGDCAGALEEVDACNTGACSGDAKDACVWADWEDWGACTVTCGGGGERTRLKKIAHHPGPKGSPCEASASLEMANCGDAPCVAPKYCAFGQWGDWGKCSKECGGGQRERVQRLKWYNSQPSDYLASSSLVELHARVESARAQSSVRSTALYAVVGAGFVAFGLLRRKNVAQE